MVLEARRQGAQSKGPELIKAVPILWIALWILSGSPSKSLWICLFCRSRQLAHWNSRSSECSFSPHTHMPHGQLPVHALQGDECEPLQMVSDHAQKAGPTLWDWERQHKPEHLTPSYRKSSGRCQHLPWLCRIKKRHTILRTSPLPQRLKRSVEREYP